MKTKKITPKDFRKMLGVNIGEVATLGPLSDAIKDFGKYKRKQKSERTKKLVLQLIENCPYNLSKKEAKEKAEELMKIYSWEELEEQFFLS